MPLCVASQFAGYDLAEHRKRSCASRAAVCGGVPGGHPRACCPGQPELSGYSSRIYAWYTHYTTSLCPVHLQDASVVSAAPVAVMILYHCITTGTCTFTLTLTITLTLALTVTVTVTVTFTFTFTFTRASALHLRRPQHPLTHQTMSSTHQAWKPISGWN